MSSDFLSNASLIIAVIFIAFLVMTASGKFNPKANAVKMLLTALLALIGYVQQSWVVAGIWTFNFALYLFLALLYLKLNALQNKDQEPPEIYTAPYDTVGTNCTACGARNEYPVDGKNHFCTHCGTMLPKAH